MSEADEPAFKMRPPGGEPTNNGKAVATLQRNSTAGRVKLVTSVTQRLTKFLNAIKLRSRRQQQQQQQQPHQQPRAMSSLAPSTPTTTAYFNPPSYGRYSDTLAHAQSSNTNSASSVLRGGSDGELPVLRNVSSLLSGDSPTENCSPMWSPSFLGGFSLGHMRVQQHQQQQLQQRSSDDTPPSSSRSRTSPSKPQLTTHGSAAPAAAAAAVTTATTSSAEGTAAVSGNEARAAGARRSHAVYDTRDPASLHVSGGGGGGASLFSCLTGDHSVDCDLPSATQVKQQQQPKQQQQQQQQQQPSPRLLQMQPLPQRDAGAAATVTALTVGSSSVAAAASQPPSGRKWDTAIAANTITSPFTRAAALMAYCSWAPSRRVRCTSQARRAR